MEEIDLSFVKRDDITNLFETNMRAYLNESSHVLKSTFDPSHITECPRRITYRTMAMEPNPVIETKKTKSFRSNRLLAWSSFLQTHSFTNSSAISIQNKDLCVSDCNYNIVGQLDYVLKINDVLFACEIFSVDFETFQNILKKGAIRKDVVEIMVYMWLVELNDGLMIYEDRNNCDFISFHIKPYKPIIKSVIKKCKRLLEHIMGGTLPDRAYKTKVSNECKQCEYMITCWEKRGD